MKLFFLIGAMLCGTLLLTSCANTSSLSLPPTNVLTLAEVDQRPRAVFTARPNYPRLLRRNNISGQAIVRFVVTAEGRVSDVVVLEATHAPFGDAAIEAVSQWRYIAALKDGQPVACLMTTPLVFTVHH
jgi:protein TonB